MACRTPTPSRLPWIPGLRLLRRDCPTVVDPAVQDESRAIVGHAPGVVHLRAARRVLACLEGTQDMGITYSRPDDPAQVNKLFSRVDSDYAADPDTRKSVTGYIVSMNNGPIACKSKRQSCVTLSSAEPD
eukprot:3619774-Rhodomonas_salina.2